jgi:archaeosine synthase beta-subunit
MPGDGQLAAGLSRQDLISALTRRAWEDEGFRDVLVSDPARAMAETFGYVPDELAGKTFALRPVDRLKSRPNGKGGRDFSVRPKRGGEPLGVFTRTFLGVPELVIALYTKRCRYQCTFCVLPEGSALTLVGAEQIAHQVDAAFAMVARQQIAIRQISIGNEGSILDARTLPAEHLKMVLERCAAHPGVESIILETRAEFITEQALDRVEEAIGGCRLTLKVGLETADDHIRNDILGKRMDLGDFERAVKLIGARGHKLSSYILLKASPWHTDEQGRADAIATCEYLIRLCEAAGVPLQLRVNSMYRAEGSPWAKQAAAAGWTPPSVFDLARVMEAVARPGVEVYAGLSAEGLATPDGHFDSRPDYRPEAEELMERYNETGDYRLLPAVAAGPGGLAESMLFYSDVRARLGPLMGQAGCPISLPQPAPGGGGPVVFTAFAEWDHPELDLSEQGFGAGWSTSEAYAKAALEAYERMLARALPTPECGFGEAVAFTREDAARRAFLEAVGRDAAVTWWQDCLTVPAVDLSTVDDSRVHAFADEQRWLGRRVWMLDITPGELPVVIVFVAEPGQPPVFGWACHVSKYRAAEAAVLEAGQALCYADEERAKWPALWRAAEFWEPGPRRIAWSTIPDADPDGESWQCLAQRARLAVTVHDLPQLCDGLAAVRVTVPALRSIHQVGGCNPFPFPV